MASLCSLGEEKEKEIVDSGERITIPKESRTKIVKGNKMIGKKGLHMELRGRAVAYHAPKALD